MKIFLNTTDINNPTIEITEQNWNVKFFNEYSGKKETIKKGLTKAEAKALTNNLNQKHNCDQYGYFNH